MTRPHPRQNAALSAALSGAVDLSALKARADAARQPPPRSADGTPTAGGGVPADSVSHVTEASFQTDVVERSLQVPVVVDLWASWSGPCKQLSPVLEKLAAEANGAWVLARVDVDANPRIAQIFGVQSVPTVVAIAGGQPVDAFSGPQAEPQIRQWIGALLDVLRDQMPAIRAAEANAGAAAAEEPVEEPEDIRVVLAEEAVERADYAAAEAAYQQILDAEPANEEARAALVQVRFLARSEAADPSAIATADADPSDVDAQLAAADAELAADADAAFGRLIGVVRRTSGDDRNRVRTHLVEMFDLFPVDDPRVAAARRDLASALF